MLIWEDMSRSSCEVAVMLGCVNVRLSSCFQVKQFQSSIPQSFSTISLNHILKTPTSGVRKTIFVACVTKILALFTSTPGKSPQSPCQNNDAFFWFQAHLNIQLQPALEAKPLQRQVDQKICWTHIKKLGKHVQIENGKIPLERSLHLWRGTCISLPIFDMKGFTYGLWFVDT